MTGSAYGWEHQKARAAAAPEVAAGDAFCAEPICLVEAEWGSRWIDPTEPWDLAHERAYPGTYRGPAHRRCNRAEGARWKQVLEGLREPDETVGAWPL